MTYSVADEFGIAYQSTRRTANPSAVAVTALEDFDTEIEARLLHAPTASAPADDDEFDVDNGGADNEPALDAVRKAIESAALNAGKESEVSLSTAPWPELSTPADTEIIAKADLPTEKVTAQSILAEARKAFNEVADVYGSGLGDHEVLVGFAPEADTGTGKGKGSSAQPIAALKGIDVIEEGDEDAAEAEEAAEETRLAEELIAGATEQVKLESEWEGLEAGQSNGQGDGTGAATLDSVAVVHWTFTKAVRYFKDLDHAAARAQIVVRDDVKSGGWFSSAPKPIAYKNCEADLELPFLIAQVDYDPQCAQHLQMLQTIYAFFVEKKGSSTTAAKSWEKLGFQGNDPRTDLNRSMKMLSVVQVLLVTQRASCWLHLFLRDILWAVDCSVCYDTDSPLRRARKEMRWSSYLLTVASTLYRFSVLPSKTLPSPGGCSTCPSPPVTSPRAA
jgi:hypothetical protein